MTIQEIKADALAMGFITHKQLPAIIAENRFQQCLIRCGSGRLICSAQDVAHWIAIIENEGSDYVRDVSLL